MKAKTPRALAQSYFFASLVQVSTDTGVRRVTADAVRVAAWASRCSDHFHFLCSCSFDKLRKTTRRCESWLTPDRRRGRVRAENSEKCATPTYIIQGNKGRLIWKTILYYVMQYIVKIALKRLDQQGLISLFTPSLVNYSHCTYPYHETFSFAPFPSHSTLILQYALTLEHLGNAS